MALQEVVLGLRERGQKQNSDFDVFFRKAAGSSEEQINSASCDTSEILQWWQRRLTGQTRLILFKIELANGVRVMYFSILTCLKLDLVILTFFDSVFSWFLGTPCG